MDTSSPLNVLMKAANAPACARPREKSDNRSRRPDSVAKIKMVCARIVKIDGALHQTQSEKLRIKIEIALRIACDRSDMMNTEKFHPNY